MRTVLAALVPAGVLSLAGACSYSSDVTLEATSDAAAAPSAASSASGSPFSSSSGSPSSSSSSSGSDSGSPSSSSSSSGAVVPVDFEQVTEVGRGGGILVESVTYRSGALLVKGQICRPDDIAAHSVVSRQHGGFEGLLGELFTGNLDDPANFCTTAAKNGFVVVESSYRGEGGSEGQIEMCLGEVDDALTLLDIVRTKPYADPTRVAAYGISHGGCITTQMALRDPSLTVAVDYFGPSDLAELDRYWHSALDQNEPEPWCQIGVGESPCAVVHRQLISIVETAAGGSPLTAPAAYPPRSPRGNLAALQVPMLFLQGTEDPLVNLPQGCFKRAALAGIEAHFIGADQQQHNPADVCGGQFSQAPLPPGSTRADWPKDRYLFVFDGQGHGFTGASAQLADSLALGFLFSRLNP